MVSTSLPSAAPGDPTPEKPVGVTQHTASGEGTVAAGEGSGGRAALTTPIA
jgi:hypothetical protein